MSETEYHRHTSGDVVRGPAVRCIDPNAGAEDVAVIPLCSSVTVTLTDAEHAAIASAAVSPGVTDYDYPELTAVIERIIADRERAAEMRALRSIEDAIRRASAVSIDDESDAAWLQGMDDARSITWQLRTRIETEGRQ